MSAFWRFSLRAWRRPEVARTCLRLQESAGADANLVLLCLWMEKTGRAADDRFLRRARAAVSRWQREVVRPLRATRCAIPKGDAWAAQVRRRVALAELDAEHAEQRTLAACAESAPRSTLRAAGNLARYLEQLHLSRRSSSRYSNTLRNALE
ncbi:MAG: TIGR02444 family protein [Myxococcales bacterium]